MTDRRREEIAFELELLEMEERFLAAKESGIRDHPDRIRFSQMRTFLRQCREGLEPAALALGIDVPLDASDQPQEHPRSWFRRDKK